MAEASLTFTITGKDEASSVLRGIQAELEKTSKLGRELSAAFARPPSLGRTFAGLRRTSKDVDALATKITRATDAMRRFGSVSSAIKMPDVRIDPEQALRGLDKIGAKVASFADQIRELGAAASSMRVEVPEVDVRPVRSRTRRRGRPLSEAEREEAGGYGRIVLTHQRRAEREAARAYREEQRDVADRKRRTRRGLHRVDRQSRTLAHPVFSTPAVAAITSLTGAIWSLKSSIEAARTLDDATTRLRMFGPNVSAADASAARSQALKDSITLGVAPEHLLNVQSEALRAGVPPEVARIMSGLIPQAAAAMGETAERLADSMGEALQQLVGMGAVKGPDDARRFINDAAGLSNFGGMDSRKMTEFLAAGGLGHGRELGLNPADTLGLASAFGAMGARTGQYDARMLGQFSQVVPKMFDRWTKSNRSRAPSETNAAVRDAPKMLGYGDISAMAKAVESGADGLLDFIERLGKLDAKTRKLVLQGYGFSESTGAVVGDIASSPGKAETFLKQARDLDRQKASSDYLSQKWNQWKDSLSFMIRQIEAGFEAIKAELGDVLKVDIIGPFRDFWTDLSRDLLDGGIRDRFHRDLTAFINGLGFQDAAAMFKSLRAGMGGFDAAGFFRGIGQGLRATIDAARSVFNALAFLSGGSDAEPIGRVGAELFGLALGLRILSPVIGTFTAVVAVFRALYDVGALGLKVAEWSGFTGSIKKLVGLDFAAGSAGLLKLAGILGLFFTGIDQGIKAGILGLPEDKNFGDWFSRHMKGLLHPFTLPGSSKSSAGPVVPATPDTPIGRNPYATGRNNLFHHSDWDGPDYRSMIQRTAFLTDDDPVGRAIIGTDATVAKLLAAARDTRNGFVPGAIVPSSATVGAGNGPAGYGAPGSWSRFSRSPGGPLGPAAGGMGPRSIMAPHVRQLAGGDDGSGSGTRSGGSRSWRNNNPGNIEYGSFAKAHGATGSDGRFAKFPDYATGRKAQENLLFDSKGYRNLTLSQAIHRWAPASENNVPAYIQAMHADPNAVMGSFSPEQRGKLLDAMQAHEGWRPGNVAGSTARSAAGGFSSAGNLRGKLAIDGKRFDFGSGGNHGAASIPLGTYPITPGTIGAWGQAHGALGINNNAIFDQSLGRMRTGIEMHAASSASMLSSGCIAIAKDQFAEVKARALDMIKRTGHAYLHVGKDGASITPDSGSPADAATSFGRARQILEQRTKDDAASPAPPAARSLPPLRGGVAHHGDVHIHVAGAGDPDAVARKVHQAMQDHLQLRTHDYAVG